MSQPSAAPESRFLTTVQALVLFVGGLVAAGFGVSAWQGLAAPLGVADGTTAFQLGRTVFQFAGFVAPVLLFVAAAGDRSLLPVRIPDRREAGVIAAGVVALYALQYGLLALLGAVGVEPVQNEAINPERYQPVYFLWMTLLSVLVVGPAEELLFRGAVQGLLKRAWGARPAIVGASGLFGALHFSVGAGPLSGVLAYVAIAFTLGMVLGVVYEWTGNIVVPTLAHGLFNALAFGMQYFSVAG
ncbi:MAG: lysostaphin resistance A-like protein [Halolamina sp.]